DRHIASSGTEWRLVGITKEPLEMRFYRKPRQHLVPIGIRLDQGGIGIQLLAPDQAIMLTAVDNCLEEAAEDGDEVAVTNAGQAGVVGQSFVEIVAQIPSHAEAVGTDVFQLSLGSNTLKDHDKLELEEDDGIDGWATERRITVAYQITDQA